MFNLSLICRHEAVMRPLAPPCPHLLPLLAWAAALLPSLPNLFIFKVAEIQESFQNNIKCRSKTWRKRRNVSVTSQAGQKLQ